MKETLTLLQGATFRRSWTICEGDDLVKPIEVITLGYPTVVQVTAHGLPNGAFPIAIVNAGKFSTSSTAAADRTVARRIDDDTFMLNVNSAAYTAYVSGGLLVYTPPKNLTGYLARAHMRKRITAPDPPIFSLSQVDGITLGGLQGSVDVEISAERTAMVVNSRTYFHVELEDVDGVVTRPIEIVFSLSKEVTR